MSPLNDTNAMQEASVEGGFGILSRGPLARGWRIVARRVPRYVETAKPPRRGSGIVAALAFVSLSWLYGGFVGGHGPAIIGGGASLLGLKISDIVISGQIETDEADIARALDLSGGTLVDFDLQEARARLLELPWTRDVALRKVYPGKLVVVVSEHRPAAIWQVGEGLKIVRRSGEVISKFGIAELLNNRFAHLPHLVGVGAAQAAADILDEAEKYPQIARRVASYQRVADQRWDVVLNNGITIKLPVANAPDAMARIADLQNQHKILDREISVVDARLSGRLVFRLTDGASKDRQKLVASRLKEMRKADRYKERQL